MRRNTSVIGMIAKKIQQKTKADTQLVVKMEWKHAFPKFENFLNCYFFSFVALFNSVKFGHYLLVYIFVVGNKIQTHPKRF